MTMAGAATQPLKGPIMPSLQAILAAVVLTISPFSSRAEAVSITEFSVPAPWAAAPWAISAGSDRHIWFTYEYANQVGEIAVGGAGRNRAISFGGVPAIAEGAVLARDGTIWFTDEGANAIVKVTPNGSFTPYVLPNRNSQPWDIANGPDGGLWFTERAGRVGKISLAGAVTEFPIAVNNLSRPWGITAGPNGNVWFTNGSEIEEISPAGAIHAFGEHDPVCSSRCSPTEIVTGPDGNLWFAERSGNQIGRITPEGDVTFFEIPTPRSEPIDIVVGPDGNLWFTEYLGNKIGRITTNGVVTEFPLPTVGSRPWKITPGPYGSLWFTETSTNRIGRLTL
jgi:streptogramin lyase